MDLDEMTQMIPFFLPLKFTFGIVSSFMFTPLVFMFVCLYVWVCACVCVQIGVISDFLSLQVDELRKGKSQVDATI